MKQKLEDDDTSEADFMFESHADNWFDSRPKYELFCNIRYFVIAIAFITMCSITAFEIFHIHTNIPSIITCGNSTFEAIALGCQFDNLSGSWVHASCYDAQITAEHDSWGWTYFRDRNGTEEIDSQSLPTSVGQNVWTIRREHYVHCALSLRKLHKAILNDGMIEEMYLDYNHTTHCTDLLANTTNDMSVISTVWTPGFLTCRKALSAVQSKYVDKKD
jgi:hypothetical protein